MSRKSNDEIKKTKENILEKGLDLLETKGYNATGIQEIADAAGIPKGSFYNYFSSKEDFGVAVIKYYAAKHLVEWIARININSKEKQKLIKVFIDIANDYDCAGSTKGCLLGNLSAEISSASEKCRMALLESMDSFKIVLINRIKEGQANGEFENKIPAEKIVDIIWSVWQGSLLEMKVKKSNSSLNHNMESLFQLLN